MDFLKACSTNIQALDAPTTLYYHVYKERDDTSLDAAADGARPSRGQTRDAVKHLLDMGALAHVVPAQSRGQGQGQGHDQDQIWIFERSPHAADFLHSQGFDVQSEAEFDLTTFARPLLSSLDSPAEHSLFAIFLSAVEASVNTTLVTRYAALHLGPLTWMIPLQHSGTDQAGTTETSNQAHHALLSFAFHVSHGRAAFILPKVQSTDLIPLSACDPTLLKGCELLLAPSGRTARIAHEKHHHSERREGFDDSLQHQRLQARGTTLRETHDNTWKQALAARLSRDAMCNEEWIMVEVLDTQPGFVKVSHAASKAAGEIACLWPAALCFAHRADLDAALGEADSISPFDNANDYLDPLVTAEEWYLGSEDRVATDVSAIDAAQADSTPTDDARPGEGSDTMPSPLYQRGLDQAAINGIYPTPPDAPAQAHVVDTAAAPTAATDPQTASGDPTQSAPLSRQASNTSVPQVEPASYHNSNDELFGDGDGNGDGGDGGDGGDEDMFGAPDVTDADFSFFDDPGAPFPSGPTQDTLDDINLTPLPPLPTSGGVPHAEEDFQSASSLCIHTTGVDDINAHAHIHGLVTASNEAQSLLPTDVGQPDINTTSLLHDTASGTEIVSHLAVDMMACSTPPLSPFSIKERLLPLPIPASTFKTEPAAAETRLSRNSSNFFHVDFNPSLVSSSSKYTPLGRFGLHNLDDDYQGKEQARHSYKPNIKLPQKPKGKRQPSGQRIIRTVKSNTSSSEEQSDSDEPHAQAGARSPVLDLDMAFAKRRKLSSNHGADTRASRYFITESEESSDLSDDESFIKDPDSLMDLLLHSGTSPCDISTSSLETLELPHVTAWPPGRPFETHLASTDKLVDDLWTIFEFGPEDFTAVAQLVSEQSNSTIEAAQLEDRNARQSCQQYGEPEPDQIILRGLARDMAKRTSGIRDAQDCDLTGLAKFSISGPMIAAAPSESDSPSKIQPRPTPRRALALNAGPAAGQHLLPIPAPFIRVQRAESKWDLLPTALDFWEPLALEPCAGQKDITAYGVLFANEDLITVVEDFLSDLSIAYENSKLGSHVMDLLDWQHEVTHGMVPFAVKGPVSSRTILSGVHAACMVLAKKLQRHASDEEDRTIVVYLFNMFKDPEMLKYICACFWSLHKAYIESAGEDPPKLVLQVLPLQAIAESQHLVVYDQVWLATLARSVYDRCPPQESPESSVWRIPRAPSFEIVAPMSRRVNFLLSEQLPKNLMQEAQIMHIAYTLSAHQDWLTAAWTDYTGRYHYSSSYCLSSTTLKDVLAEVQSVTAAMMGDATTWRLFVAKVGSMSDTERAKWQGFSGPLFATTLVEVDTSPSVQIFSPPQASANVVGDTVVPPGANLVTPTSTPQLESSAFTVSPEAQGHTPATPAPGEPAQEPATVDPDAHLLDTADETWALLLPFSATKAPNAYTPKRVLASGILLKRGDGTANKALPALGVDVVGTVAPRLHPGTTQWLLSRSPEGLLREALAWYRGLGLLAKLRRVRGAETGVIPWHVATAINGAKALDRFLK